MKYTNVPIPGPLYLQFKRQGAISSRLYISEDDQIQVMVMIRITDLGELKHAVVCTTENVKPEKRKWPTWEEVVQARDFFFPEDDAMIIIPKAKDFFDPEHSGEPKVNPSLPHQFNIWQMPKGWVKK